MKTSTTTNGASVTTVMDATPAAGKASLWCASMTCAEALANACTATARFHVQSAAAPNVRWCEQQRQEWIAETLRVFGYINRQHLERKFGISTPQASKDLSAFARANPRAMVYDVSAK